MAIKWDVDALRRDAKKMTNAQMAIAYGVAGNTMRKALARHGIEPRMLRASKRRGDYRKLVAFKLLPAELEQIKAAAANDGLTTSQYIRRQLGLRK